MNSMPQSQTVDPIRSRHPQSRLIPEFRRPLASYEKLPGLAPTRAQAERIRSAVREVQDVLRRRSVGVPGV